MRPRLITAENQVNGVLEDPPVPLQLRPRLITAENANDAATRTLRTVTLQ